MRPIHEKTVPGEFRSIVEHLESWVIQQRVMDKVKAACLASVSDHLARQLPDYERLLGIETDQIEMRLISHALMFQHGGMAGPHIMTELHLSINEAAEDENGAYRTNQSLGLFRHMTFLDGKSRDGFSFLHLWTAESEAAQKYRWATPLEDGGASSLGRQGVEEVSEWLRAQAKAQGNQATVYTQAAKLDGRFLIIPIHLAGGLEAYDFASALQDLEDDYNGQEPKPDWMLVLRPAAAPRP